MLVWYKNLLFLFLSKLFPTVVAGPNIPYTQRPSSINSFTIFRLLFCFNLIINDYFQVKKINKKKNVESNCFCIQFLHYYLCCINKGKASLKKKKSGHVRKILTPSPTRRQNKGFSTLFPKIRCSLSTIFGCVSEWT